jgi:zinc transport system ATP-binding protein
MHAVHVEDVWVSFEGHTVLEAIDLAVDEKDFYAIIGPNGGGKTTLLRVILGLIHPDRGRVTIYGKPPAESQDIFGYVPQIPALDPDMPLTVEDVVLMGRISKANYLRRFTASDRRIVRETLERVGMAQLRSRQIGKLSGGQFQRIMIARALATQPKILILDEPTSSLDTTIEENIYELLKKLSHEIAILMVTHDIGVISQYVQRVACLNKRMFTHGTKEITRDMIEATYECPVDLIAHGIAHRVLDDHEKEHK